MNIPTLEKFTEQTHTLPATGTWKKSIHIFDRRTAHAIRAAMASGRPLLVRGEPGTGKSQLARAAAEMMNRKFLSHVVDAHTEIQDLWYRFDAVSRLGNAQVLSVTAKNEDDVETALNPEKYLSPGILWWAFSWESAKKRKCHQPLFVPDESCEQDDKKGVVLLIDEIDKADADLPNSLLETLDNGKFTVPWINETIGASADDANRPLVVITTNEDRQLPSAFIRRCMVLDLRLPEKKENLFRYLKERAAFHFPVGDHVEDQALERDAKDNLICQSCFDDSVLTEAAAQLYGDRQQADSLGVTPPGQAEYLDMLRVLHKLVPDDTEEQIALLAKIKDFALKKYPGMQDQDALDESENQNAQTEE